MYNVDYFIKKFETIPEERWCIRQLHNDDDQFCALGHCGARYGRDLEGEAKSLHTLFLLKSTIEITLVNDYMTKEYPQPHPKQRVLAALYDLKATEAVKEAEEIIKDRPETHNQRMEREDRLSEITECAREDFILNWREGK